MTMNHLFTPPRSLQEMSYNTDIPDPNLQDGLGRKYIKQTNNQLNENLQLLMHLEYFHERIVHYLALPGYILQRHSFGERFFTRSQVLRVGTPMLLAAYMAGSAPGVVLSLAVYATGLYHCLLISIRNKRKEKWHSKFDGASHLLRWFPGRLKLIEGTLEPALMMVAALFFLLIANEERPHDVPLTQFYWSSAFAAYLFAIGYGMFVSHRIQQRRFRNDMLDRRDAQIENEAMAQLQDELGDAVDEHAFAISWRERQVHQGQIHTPLSGGEDSVFEEILDPVTKKQTPAYT